VPGVAAKLNKLFRESVDILNSIHYLLIAVLAV
jgi:hypothetical protein